MDGCARYGGLGRTACTASGGSAAALERNEPARTNRSLCHGARSPECGGRILGAAICAAGWGKTAIPAASSARGDRAAVRLCTDAFRFAGYGKDCGLCLQMLCAYGGTRCACGQNADLHGSDDEPCKVHGTCAPGAVYAADRDGFRGDGRNLSAGNGAALRQRGGLYAHGRFAACGDRRRTFHDGPPERTGCARRACRNAETDGKVDYRRSDDYISG